MVWQILNNLPEHGSDRQPQVTTAGGDCYTLCVGAERHHTSVPVLPTLLAMLIMQVGLLAAMFTVPVFSDALAASTNAFSVLQYAYVVFWALIAFLNWHLYREFYHIWVLGYHNFYTTTQFLHGLSFYIYTSGLVLLCVLGAAVRDYCPGGALNHCGKHVHLSPVNYQQIVAVMLTLPAVLCTLKLAGEVYRFNQSEMPADVLVDDLGVRLSQTTLYVGLGKPSSILTVLEVQGAVIASLRRRLEVLNRQVARLANNLEGYLDPVE